MPWLPVIFLTLFGLSFFVASGEMTNWLNISKVLRICFIVGLTLTVVITMLSREVGRSK